MLIKIAFLVFAITCVNCDPDFYWRPYFGTIPKDAVLATPTTSTRKVYIGRAPLKENGALLGELDANNQGLTVSQPGLFGISTIRTINNYVEILCSPSANKLVWKPATYQTLDNLLGKVVGGYETSNTGVLYIGRGSYGTDVRIGKIPGYDNVVAANRRLYVADKIKGEIKIDTYEVLTYTV